MKKLVWGLALVLSLAACGEKSEAPKAGEKPVVKIGATLPLTGDSAVLGQAARAGMQMALKDLNQETLHYNYELIFEDTASKQSVVAVAANKLLNADKVDAIETIVIANGMIVAPLADKADAFHLCASFYSNAGARLGKNTFVQGTSHEDLFNKIVETFKANNVRKVALVAVRSSVVEKLVQKLHSLLDEENIENTVEVSNPGERDFRIMLQKLKQQGFENFYIAAFPPETDIIINQMHELGISNSNIYGQGIDVGTRNEIYNGIHCFGFNFGNQQFIDRLMEEYNLSNVYGGAISYDFVNMVVEAYENLYQPDKRTTTAEVVTYIQNKKSYDCASEHCDVLENGFITNPPSHRIYKDGKPLNLD